MITLQQIQKAKDDYKAKKGITPTRIVMNPVGANKLYQYLRKMLLEEIVSGVIFNWVLEKYPPVIPEGTTFICMKVCYAYHYAEDYFEVTD